MTKAEELKDYLRDIKDAVLKRKSKSVEVPLEWLTEEEREKLKQIREKKSLPTPRIPTIVIAFPRGHISLHRPTWRSSKRFIAGLFLIVDAVALISSLGSIDSLPSGLFFGLHAFILLDYLMKTKEKSVFEVNP